VIVPTLVVVIEDDADERVALGRVLRVGGYDVISYASAEEFLASPPRRPLCLLLDMQLEGMSGLELLRALRAGGSTLPVIVITAGDDALWRDEVEQLGCVAYLRKPCQARALIALIRSLSSDSRDGPLVPRC
jgi:FixJ family two-component response regulator